MTRRITWIILLTVWATLIAAGVGAYLTTRSVLLEDLDIAIVDSMMSKSEYTAPDGQKYFLLGALHKGARRLIINDKTGRTEQRETGKGEPHAIPIEAKWVRLPEGKHRQVVASVFARPIKGGETTTFTIAETKPAAEFDGLMNRLGIALTTVTIVGGVIAAVLARIAAKTSLRPLRATADVIGTIDDRTLDRRIDASRLPPELIRMAEKLNAMLERLDRSTQQRRRFLANASHELRTPVAALMTALELSSRRPRDTETYRQTIDMCLADARHLRQLVEALMSQVKSEAPSEPTEIEEIDISKFLDECVRIVRPLAETKAVAIEQSVESDLPPLRTQPMRLRSAVINLLSNAVEYNREHGRIDVSIERAGEWVMIEVCDTGPGIAPEHLPYVFDAFFRGDESRAPSEHLGLGLYLVHSHAQALGGQVTVQSEPGVGTCFQIRLPAPVDSAQLDSASLTATNPPQFAVEVKV